MYLSTLKRHSLRSLFSDVNEMLYHVGTRELNQRLGVARHKALY